MISSIKYLMVVITIFYLHPDEVYTIDKMDLAVVTKNEIKFIYSLGTDNSTAIDVQLSNINSTTYDPIKNDIYVSVYNFPMGSIFRIKTTGKTAFKTTRIIAESSKKVYGIAIDYLTSTLYWTTYDGIYYVRVQDDITDVTGDNLFKSNIKHCNNIAIDVDRRNLYWVNYFAKIEWTNLDKIERQELKENLTDPQGIMMDVDNNTLYWIDRDENLKHSLISMHLEGNATRKVLVYVNETKYPYAIAQDKWNAYWIDWILDSLWMMPKGSFRSEVSPTLVSNIVLKDEPVGLFVISSENAKQQQSL